MHIADEEKLNKANIGQSFLLPVKAVHIQCLDSHKQPVLDGFGSGFIVREKDCLYLYTAWHLVTGFELYGPPPTKPTDRRFIEVRLQKATPQPGGLVAIGQAQSFVLPLFDQNGKPLWLQDQADRPHVEANALNIRVPVWHDAVKTRLPSDLQIESLQLIEGKDLYTDQLVNPVGTRLLIVGYPYGFSALGQATPTGIVITRHVAAIAVENRLGEQLLDGPCAPGMSGGPVFCEASDQSGLLLTGVYTGTIFPDAVLHVKKNERTTALGTYSNIAKCWIYPDSFAFK